MKNKYVVVTGVSSGIGFDVTGKLIERGFYVFGSVRKKEDAEKMKESFGDLFTPLLFDVTDVSAIKKAVKQVQDKIGNGILTGLINNSGIAVTGPMIHLSDKVLHKQFDVNFFGVLNVTKSFLPLLKGQNPGRIINISSVSGKSVFPFLGAYAASKHALEAISDALRRELMIYGIDVILIEPGSTESAIWEKIPDISEFDGTDYEEPFRKMLSGMSKHLSDIMPVDKVTKIIIKALNTKNPRTRYLVVKNKLTNWYLPRLLPERKLDKIFAKMMKLKRL